MLSFLLSVVAAVVGVGFLLYVGEILQHRYDYHPEITRKFIHISVATFAVFWPLFMTWGGIMLMSVLLFCGVLVSKRISFFHSIHDVHRLTWGEIFFPVSIGLSALLSSGANSTWIFAAAMLHLGLADGLAAVAGTLFGRHHRYKVFGHTKSRVGTITFWFCSFMIILICGVLNGPHVSIFTLLLLPIFATLLENVGVAGSDNVLVPIFVVVFL